MAQQNLDFGTVAANDGETLFAGFTKVQANFDDIYDGTVVFPDILLESGGVINWNSGDVTLTHSSNALAFAGATSGYSWDDTLISRAPASSEELIFKIDITSNEAASGNYNMTQSAFDVNPFSGRKNQSMRFGYNIAAGGGVDKAGEPAWALEWESFFEPSDDAINWFEWHLAHVTSAGSVYRPISIISTRNDNTFKKVMFTATVDFINLSGTLHTTYNNGDWSYNAGAILSKYVNNEAWLRQYNGTSDGFVELMRVNASSEVTLAPDYSLTGSQAKSAVYVGGTWNTSGTPTAIKLDITSTSSNAASLLMDLQVGSSSKFKVRKDGYAAAERYLDSTYAYGLLPSVAGSTYMDINSTFIMRLGDSPFTEVFRVTTGGVTSSALLTPMKGELTIASGAITVTGGYHRVDTQSDDATDDLDTINGGADGMQLTLRAENDGRTVVVKDGTGNIQIAGDMTLDNTQDTITLMYDGTLTAWLEIGRAASGA